MPGRRGKRSGVMLEEHADEALEAADDRPVQHHRERPRAGLGDVIAAEPLGGVEVDLHRAELPLPAERVLQGVLDLRTVEGAVARSDGELAA